MHYDIWFSRHFCTWYGKRINTHTIEKEGIGPLSICLHLLANGCSCWVWKEEKKNGPPFYLRRPLHLNISHVTLVAPPSTSNAVWRHPALITWPITCDVGRHVTLLVPRLRLWRHSRFRTKSNDNSTENQWH